MRRVAALPDRVIRGGATVLQLQAACGFRAFAEHRLGSTELESVELGMDALESGIVVHRRDGDFLGRGEDAGWAACDDIGRAGGGAGRCIGEGLRKIAAAECD